MSDEFPFDVFLSHTEKDKTIVRALAEQLRKDGLNVWFDEWALKPGDSIPAMIELGLKRSRVLMLFISSNALGSDWLQLESGTFRFRDPLNKKRRFIPLKLDNSSIDGSLAQFLHIDWQPMHRERNYATVLDACRRPEGWPVPSPRPYLEAANDACIQFASLFQELGQLLSDADNRINGARFSASWEELNTQFQSDYVTISIFGQVKAGKSTLVNAMVGHEISPIGIDVTTAVPIRIKHGDRDGHVVYRHDGSMDVLHTSLKEWMLVQSDSQLRSVDEIVCTTTSSVMGYRGQIQLIDSPGYGSRVQLHSELSEKQMAHSVIAILVYRLDQALYQDFQDALVQLHNRGMVTIALCNIDDNYLASESRSPREFDAVVRKREAELRSSGAHSLRINVLSAFYSESEALTKELAGLSKTINDLVSVDILALEQRRIAAAGLLTRAVNAFKGMIKQDRSDVEKIQQELSTIDDNAKRLLNMPEPAISALSFLETSMTANACAAAGGTIGGAGAFYAITAALFAPVLIPVAACVCMGAAFGYGVQTSRRSGARSELVRNWNALQAELLRTQHFKGLADLTLDDSGAEFTTQELAEIRKKLENFNRDISDTRDNEINQRKSREEYIRYHNCITNVENLKRLETGLKDLDGKLRSLVARAETSESSK